MEKRESILLVPVLSAEFLVKQLRDKYDPSSIRGIPPHVTVLFPFKHPDEIIGEDINKLKEIFSATEEFLFVLQSINTFHGVVFLQPSEREKFTSLTEKIAEAFPEYPPYDGRFTKINPHLTIGHELGERFDKALEIIKKEIENKLPIQAKAQEVWLMESKNGMWTVKGKFPLLI